jgi:hypothetical protein
MAINILKRGIIIFFLIVIVFFAVPVRAESGKIINFFDRASIYVYCSFFSCESKSDVVKDYQNKEDVLIIDKQKEREKKEKVKRNIAPKNREEKKEEKKETGAVKKSNNNKVIVEKYYNTIEKKPIKLITNNYPKEIIEKKIIEKYDDSSLENKIKNNRRLISQLAGLDTSDDNLSDNSLNDLADVNILNPSNGQVLT